ncbi:hypothetical protein JCM16303_004813 [Sporobolomyces ruberrimus]
MARSTSTSKASSSATSKVKSSFTSTKPSSASASKAKKTPSIVSAAPEKKKEKKELSGLYNRLYKDAKKKMGPPIHREDMDDIETILLQFDHEESFGPCSRISRLERFERAEKLGLNPDPEIGDILRSNEGRNRKEYKESVFADL